MGKLSWKAEKTLFYILLLYPDELFGLLELVARSHVRRDIITRGLEELFSLDILLCEFFFHGECPPGKELAHYRYHYGSSDNPRYEGTYYCLNPDRPLRFLFGYLSNYYRKSFHVVESHPLFMFDARHYR